MARLIQDWVTEQAALRPDAVAVAGKNHSYTYAELDLLSNRLANLLKHRGVQHGDPVCFLLPKSAQAILAIVSILKADAIYVPIDIASPAERIAKIVKASGARWLLGDGAARGLIDNLIPELAAPDAISVGWLGNDDSEGERFSASFTLDDILAGSATRPEWIGQPDSVAYLLFTSGSTGIPKGVMITHSNVIHFIDWAVAYFGTDATDVMPVHPPLHFDMSCLDIYSAFATGARLQLIPPELNLFPHKMAEFIRSQQITQWYSVPSVLNMMAKHNVIHQDDFPSLKRLIWAGEVLPTPTLIHWMQRLPQVQFTDLYGPTETTISSSYYTVPSCPQDPNAPIPIGRACGGEELLVLDEQMNPLPAGVLGDLYIRGAGVSPGYWNDPEKTRTSFVPNPRMPGDILYKTGDLAELGTDGEIYFHGRADYQVKSRGYRIELGEVETAMNAIEYLHGCAVVAVQGDGFEGAILCAAYVPMEGVQIKPADIRERLAHALPAYMLPSRWKCYEKLPVNINGKIDRIALRNDFIVQGAG